MSCVVGQKDGRMYAAASPESSRPYSSSSQAALRQAKYV